MNLWIVSQLDASPSVKLLMAAAEAQGHTVQHVHPFRYHIMFAAGQDLPTIVGEERSLTFPDVALTRLGSASSPAALHFIRHLELCGVYCCNSSHGLERSRNKIRSFDELSRNRVPIPRTAFVTSKCSLQPLLERIPGPPWIAKLPESSQGKGVMLVESEAALHSLVDAVEALNGRLTVQEFIAKNAGSDLRVLVVGGSALAAMRRTAPKGDFRANLHQGGVAEAVEIDDLLRSISEQAAKALGLGIAGVDLMETPDGYAVIEVNGSPGLKGLQSVNEVDVAGEIIRFLASNVG